MTIWANKETTGSTSWAFDSGDVTTTNWGKKTGDAPSDLFGITDSNTGVTGTYTSIAAATSSVLGGVYHMFDDQPFRFGTDSDFMFEYSTTFNCFSIYTNPTVKAPLFRVTPDGYMTSARVASQDPSGEGAGIGSLAFNQSTNKLYIRTY